MPRKTETKVLSAPKRAVEFDLDDLPSIARQFQDTKAAAAKIAERQVELHDELERMLLRFGQPDEKKHRWIEEIPGVVNEKGKPAKLKYERRRSEELDRDRVMRFLETHHYKVNEDGKPDPKGSPLLDDDGKPVTLLQHCTKTVEVFDEDAFYALVWDKLVPQTFIKRATVESITWAVKIV